MSAQQYALERDPGFKGGQTMEGRVGDRVILESERTGQAAREGKIVEVLGAGEVVHYRVRWEDGHESTLFPSAGSITIIHKASKAGRPKTPTSQRR
jgi:Domain of unknown function (DUF1918)